MGFFFFLIQTESHKNYTHPHQLVSILLIARASLSTFEKGVTNMENESEALLEIGVISVNP